MIHPLLFFFRPKEAKNNNCDTQQEQQYAPHSSPHLMNPSTVRKMLKYETPRLFLSLSSTIAPKKKVRPNAP